VALAGWLCGVQAEQGDSILSRDERIRHDSSVAQRPRCHGLAIDDGENAGRCELRRVVELRQAIDLSVVLGPAGRSTTICGRFDRGVRVAARRRSAARRRPAIWSDAAANVRLVFMAVVATPMPYAQSSHASGAFALLSMIRTIAFAPRETALCRERYGDGGVISR
jgi:hypothetical protein